jgi:hypothetical protein
MHRVVHETSNSGGNVGGDGLILRYLGRLYKRLSEMLLEDMSAPVWPGKLGGTAETSVPDWGGSFFVFWIVGTGI